MAATQEAKTYDGMQSLTLAFRMRKQNKKRRKRLKEVMLKK